MSADIRAEAARIVLAAWDTAGAGYSVLNGLEKSGEVGRDIDLLVPPGSSGKLLKIAREILQQAGYRVATPSPIWGARIIASSGEWDSMMEFHTVTAVAWRNVVFAEWEVEQSRKTSFPENYWASFAKQVLLPLLSNPTDKFTKSASVFRELADNRDNIRARCIDFLGEEKTTHLFNALEASDPSLCNFFELRRLAMARAARRGPLQSAVRIVWQSLKQFIAPFVPCAPIIALVGPDGVGKSTILSELSSGSKSIFNKVIVRHWRPGLLPNLGGKPSAAGPASPRRNAGRWPWLRVGYYFWDFLLGHWLKDRRDTALQRLVIYDRCALDMSVDPLRYGLSSARPARWLALVTPKPDLTILLDGDPAAIHSRKAELSEDEISIQLTAWRALYDAGKIGARIDTSAPVETVVKHLRELILDTLMKKLQ